METPLIAPQFASEAEEAEWWYANRERVSGEFERAAAEGRLGRGTAMRRAMEAGSIQLDEDDASKARAVAARKGIPYQTYIKTLIHEALEKEPAA